MRLILTLGIVYMLYFAYVNSDACVQCNSSSDPKCATNPEQFMAKQCANTSSQCYTRVLDGNTIRGCASDLNNATSSRCNNVMECLICSFSEGCNRNVFPQHRVSCLQCSDDLNSTCATEIYAKPTICPIYKLGDQCYIRRDNKNNTSSFQRGCLSSAQANNVCKNISNCYTCEGAGCNFLEANSTYIPLAPDSAMMSGASLVLVVMAVIVTNLH